MKAKITKQIVHTDGNISFCDSLYNFQSVTEARKRLQSIKNMCRYPIVDSGKNFFTADKYGEIYIFRVEKQS